MSRDPDKDRRKVVSKNISGPSRDYASLLRDIIGNTRLARQGLGLSHFQQWSKISAAERRTMDQAEVRRTEDDQRKARAIELGKQGVWIKWNM